MDHLEARNDVVFNGVAPRVDRAFLLAGEEAELWMLAGARGLGSVTDPEINLEGLSSPSSSNL
jgi:hypothetical protein